VLGAPTETFILYLYVFLFPLSIAHIYKTQGSFQELQAVKQYFDEESFAHVETFDQFLSFSSTLMTDKLWLNSTDSQHSPYWPVGSARLA